MTAFRSRTATEPLSRRYARRKGLLLSCALGTTVALAVQPGTASAQAINAQPSFSPFTPVNRTFTPGEGTETIRVSNPSTVINWDPTSTPTGDYEFLPAGNTVTFQGPGNYAVLNRIGITQPVRFDGTVISQSLDGSGAVTGIGGTILFSAPSGIIIGSSAIFDVGNLVLTTLGVSNLGGDDGYGNFDFVDTDGSIGFFNPDSAGGIVTEAGSQIRANAAPGGYVALVGATVDHGGSILVSGSAALIAADETTINLTPGQFRVSTSYSQESRSVITRSGSVIDASGAPGGNIALTAPFVSHGGAIRVDGQAALVAGRSVEISVSQANGLFNIAVPVGVNAGPDDPNQPQGVTVTGTGTIGGPAADGTNGPHAIYMVASADEDAVTTLLLQGAVGFDPAPVGASVENGQIVIAAGYNVTDGAIEEFPAQENLDGPGFTGPPGPANIQIDDGAFTSDITARAYGDITIHGGTFTSMDAYAAERFIADTNNNSIDFSGDLNATAAGGGYSYYGYDNPGFASLSAIAGRTLRVRGDLSVTALAGFDYAEGQGETAAGGRINVTADADSSVIVDGSATLDVSAEGLNSGAAGGYGRGGNVLVSTNPGGTIQIGGDLDILASGTGGDAEGFSRAAGGDGTGGDARLYADGGSISVGGDLSIDVAGTGGANDTYYGGYYGGVTGAAGEGGSAGIIAKDNGTIVITGNSLLNASGQGGIVGADNAGNTGGYGGGGGVFITASYGGSTTLSGTTDIDVTGIGGTGPNGGVGVGGRTNAFAYQGGEVVLTGALGMDARGIGAAANSDGAGTGGAGYGGYAGLAAVAGGSVTFGNANLSADGIGGDGVSAGGDGYGGVPSDGGRLGAFIIAESGQVNGATATLSAAGTGGTASAGAGGAATGGDAEIDVYNGSQSAIVLSGAAVLDASARGGNGTTTGGSAQGGVTYAVAESGNAALSVGGLTIGATALGGNGGTGAGGTATGGSVTIGLPSGFDGTTDDGSFVSTAAITAETSARGGDGATGGDGTAGSIALTAEGGTLTTGDMTFTATGTGGNGSGGAGGAGTGGAIAATFTVRTPLTDSGSGGVPPDGGQGVAAASDGANATIGDFVAATAGIGGTGTTPGAARYGTISLSATSSTVAFDNVNLSLTGDTPLDPADTTTITVNDSQFDIATGFALTTPGAADIELSNSVATDNGTFAITADRVTFNADLSAFQVAGASTFDVARTGTGTVSGSSVIINALNSAVAFDGGLAIDASATGTTGATGGSVSIDASADSAFSSGATDIDVSATGAAGFGGAATGGTFSMRAADGSSALLGAGTIDATGTGGSGSAVSGVQGGAGTGGSVSFFGVNDGTVGASGALGLIADGRGGDGATGGVGSGGGINITAQADGGTLSFADLTGSAGGFGGAGAAAGGAAAGGDIFVVTELGYGATGAGVGATFGDLSLAATGVGGSGATGGDATAGVVQLFSQAGTMTVNGDLSLAATALGGTGATGAGGAATGGLAFAYASDGGTLAFDNAVIDASATGGSGANGGAGSAGFSADTVQSVESGALLYAQGGTINGTTATVRAVGTGGAGTAGVGGAGTGGTAQMGALNAATPSSLSLTDAVVNVSAFGGNGTAGGGAANAGLTGLAIAQSLNGAFTVSNTLSGVADAAGGSGGTGDGGDAAGGFIQIGTVSGGGSGTPTGSATFGAVTASSSALGGTGANGGDGAGGQLSLTARGGTLSADSVTFALNGAGGDASAGTGGTGAAGLADMLITTRFQTTDPSTVTIGSYTATSAGTGGTGQVAGASQYGGFQFEVDGSSATFGSVDLTTTGDAAGPGLGDTSQLNLADATLGVTGGFDLSTPGLLAAVLTDSDATLSGLTVDAAGVDIAASGSSFAVAGPAVFDVSKDGGGLEDTTGGSFALNADGSDVTFNGLTINASGSAGAGGSLAYGGTGGTVTLAAANGGSISTGAVQINAGGIGGSADGSFPGSGDGGAGTGGTVTATAGNGGTISFGAGSIGASGSGGALQGGTTGAGGLGQGGTIQLVADAGGTMNASGALDLVAAGTGGTGPTGGIGRGGTIAVRALGGTLAFGALNASADGRGAAGTDGGDGFGGSVELGGGAGGTGGATFGTLALAARGFGGNGSAAGGNGFGGGTAIRAATVAVTFGDATLNVAGVGGAGTTPGTGDGGTAALAASDATLTGGNVNISASGGGQSAGGNAPGSWTVSAENGTVDLAGADFSSTGSAGAAEGVGGIITLADGTFNVAGNGAFSALGGVEVDASGSGTLTGGGVIFGGGPLTVNQADPAANGATIDVADLTVAIDGDFTAAEGSVVRASNSLTIAPDGKAIVAGTLAAPAITINAVDIDIQNSGFVGTADTDTVNLEVAPGSDGPVQTVIGGDEDGPGYTLTNDEAGRIRAGRLRITVPTTGSDPTRDPDVVIRDLTLSATPAPGGGGAVNALEINVVNAVTPDAAGIRPAAVPSGAGIARVEGDVLLANAGDSSQILIQADGLISLVTPDASLRVQDGQGNPAGEIGLASANIWSASQALLDQLAANTDFDGRDDALLANGGEETPRGFIEAGNVTLFVGDTLFVQNSGNADTFAGITVTGDLTITAAGASPIEVQAFGRRLNPDGTFVDNSDFFRTVTFSAGEGGDFTDTAQFNLCVIATGVCPGDEPEPPAEQIQPPTSDQVSPPDGDAGDETSSVSIDVNDEFDDNSVFDTNELIEEPVTSGGDSGAWSRECAAGETDGECANGGSPGGGSAGAGNTGGGSNGN